MGSDDSHFNVSLILREKVTRQCPDHSFGRERRAEADSMLLSWCLMSSDVIWHIRDKLWPMPKHGSIRKVYACLAVTCHLHFWQNDRDFLRATVVTRGWNGYRNKSQHRKSTLEKKILPQFQQGFEPATFQSRVQCSNHWAIPAPQRIRTEVPLFTSLTPYR